MAQTNLPNSSTSARTLTMVLMTYGPCTERKLRYTMNPG
jgi:hypothetical protein